VTKEGQREVAATELQLAEEELRAAHALLGARFARIALSRVYFAVFHAVRALLYSRGLEPRTHTGVQHLFNVHFVKGGDYGPETSRLIARLQKFRQEADCAQAFVVDETGAREELDAATDLIERIRSELASKPN
jgi:hypothetical protein